MIGTSAKLSLNCRPSIKRTIREVRRKWIFSDKIRCWSDLIQGPKENNNPQKSWMSLEFIWVKVFLILLAKNLARMPWIKMESTTYDFPPLSISVSPSQRLLLSASRHSTVIGSHRLVIQRQQFSFVIWTLGKYWFVSLSFSRLIATGKGGIVLKWVSKKNAYI